MFISKIFTNRKIKINKLYECKRDVPKFTLEGKILPSKVFIEDICGDTFKACFWLGDNITKFSCRCLGYDSPEMKPRKDSPNRDKEKEAALNAKNRLIELMKNCENIIYLRSYQFDKYGRLLVKIFNEEKYAINDDEKNCINNIMIKEGHGYEYDGGRKKNFNSI